MSNLYRNKTNPFSMETTNRWKMWGYALISVSLMGMQSCSNTIDEPETEAIDEQAYIDEIKFKDSLMQAMLKSMDEIEGTLVATKEENGVVEFEAASEGSVQSQKDRIILDIQLLNHLLAENKKKIEEFKQKIGYYHGSQNKYKAQVADLDLMVKERDATIARYMEMVNRLESENKLMAQQIDSLNKSTAEKDEVIKQKDEQLLTAYMIKGSKKELKRKGVIESKGGILGLGAASTVNPNLDKSALTSLNTHIVTSIPIESKKARLLSAHPRSSYTFNREGNEITTLEIINPDEFWKNSKYMVIQTN